jgi:hypothetical protein
MAQPAREQLARRVTGSALLQLRAGPEHNKPHWNFLATPLRPRSACRQIYQTARNAMCGEFHSFGLRAKIANLRDNVRLRRPLPTRNRGGGHEFTPYRRSTLQRIFASSPSLDLTAVREYYLMKLGAAAFTFFGRL